MLISLPTPNINLDPNHDPNCKVWGAPIPHPVKEQELNKRHSTMFLSPEEAGSPMIDVILEARDVPCIP